MFMLPGACRLPLLAKLIGFTGASSLRSFSGSVYKRLWKSLTAFGHVDDEAQQIFSLQRHPIMVWHST